MLYSVISSHINWASEATSVSISFGNKTLYSDIEKTNQDMMS